MKKRALLFKLSGFIVCIVLALGLSSCKAKREHAGEPDAVLMSYLPKALGSYEGDGGYYHVIKTVETLESKGKYTALLRGEVKDLTQTRHYTDHRFEIEWVVDSEKITQKTSGNRLNDSIFKEIVVLKTPIEIGNKWTHNVVDADNKKIKVTGEIMSIDEETHAIVVKHSTPSGYFEERTIVKEQGVTSFIRLVAFKNESSLTGYHIVENSSSKPEENLDLEERIVIPSHLFALILGFNMAWENYVNEADDGIFDFIISDSEAQNKITAVDHTQIIAVDFISFYPYEMDYDHSGVKIYVIESYKSDSDELIQTKVVYHVVE
ncbi:MAG TPA: hypothetical protein DCS67_05625, partial [Clostridiales bacterium UBA8960]|nr:hypothetical protein [Clostridiales bacterium UBA8960]